MKKKKILPESNGLGNSICTYDTDILSDEIIKIASPNKPVTFKLLFENTSFDKRGFYNVNSGKDVELKVGETYNDTYDITFQDLDNGWVRYGINLYNNKKTLYVSGSKREFLNKCIKYVEKKYPDEIIDRYDLEIIVGDVSGSLLISLDSNKNLLKECQGQWIFSMKNIELLIEYGYMDRYTREIKIFE